MEPSPCERNIHSEMSPIHGERHWETHLESDMAMIDEKSLKFIAGSFSLNMFKPRGFVFTEVLMFLKGLREEVFKQQLSRFQRSWIQTPFYLKLKSAYKRLIFASFPGEPEILAGSCVS